MHKKIEVTYVTDDQRNFKRWINFHPREKGKWIKLDRVWLYSHHYEENIYAVACGEFYMHRSYGINKYDLFWQGSYYFNIDENKSDMDWHGLQAHSINEVFDIVSKAKYPELKYYLWGEQ